MARCVELALNRDGAGVLLVGDRDQVDACVTGAAPRPFAPEVDLFELVSETRVMEQELTGEFLEERALLALACRARTVLVQERIQCVG